MVRSARPKRLNIVLSGGGIKGIAFAGAFEVIRKKNYLPVNLAGVSAGAIAASLAGAGYGAEGMLDVLDGLEFGKMDMDSVGSKVPAVRYLADFARKNKMYPDDAVNIFLNQLSYQNKFAWRFNTDPKRGLINNIIKLCRDGCLFDGDLLEEWIAGALRKKGIRTFADLRGGMPDQNNPSGYKVRMTGVDCNRLKVVTLPDDVAFYGIDPDSLEVAKAVRISTSVPFAFKPVVLSRLEDGVTVRYNLVDGGVLDSFPTWLLGNSSIPSAGFKLRSAESKPKSLGTPLAIFKSLVAAVHDIGTPGPGANSLTYTGEIDTGNISFLDFGLSEEQKQQMYESGRKTALDLFT